MELKVVITGMHCVGCVDAVTAALTRIDDIRVCDASVGAIRVVFDESITRKVDILEAIRSAGAFDVQSFSASS